MSTSKDGKQPQCKQCAIEGMKNYRSQNIGRSSACARNYYWNNREKIAAKYLLNKAQANEYARKYQAENADKILEVRRKHRSENPDQYAAYGRARRARERGADGSHTAEDVRKILENQKNLCAACTKKLIMSGSGKYQVDHVVPLSKGGSDWPHNLQILCPSCNHRKHAKDPFDWAKENGKLL